MVIRPEMKESGYHSVTLSPVSMASGVNRLTEVMGAHDMITWGMAQSCFVGPTSTRQAQEFAG